MTQPRGQTLVLFALTLLLLAVMVCVTISIGMKAREKVELQLVADTAAYTNAVATARTFNGISVLNREIVGHMVAMAGTESLISWSSLYVASVQALDTVAQRACPAAAAPNTPLDTEVKRLTNGQVTWNSLDDAAGTQARQMQDNCGNAYGEQQKLLHDKLQAQFLKGQFLANQFATAANQGSPWNDMSAPASGDVVSMREIGAPTAGAGCAQGAACDGDAVSMHELHEAMGSRGFSFVTGRGPGATVIQGKLQSLMPTNVTITFADKGSGYWGQTLNHAAGPPTGYAAWADDEGTLTITGCGGPDTELPMAYVRSTDVTSDQTDEHQWSPTLAGWPVAGTLGGGFTQDSTPPNIRHTMGSCDPKSCPAMWPSFMDYNPALVSDGQDVYGQPKNYAVLQRDYGVRPYPQADPWNLLFTFRFTSGGSGATFDNSGIRLASGLDISKQVALATGIAYYHRMGHWQEPPNLMNPFWRATLVAADVDFDGKSGDVQLVLNNIGVSTAASAYTALKGAGFTGIH